MEGNTPLSDADDVTVSSAKLSSLFDPQGSVQAEI
jgi:hypothetical protein